MRSILPALRSRDMKVLLCGEWEAAELHAWRRALGRAWPEASWLDHEQALAQADEVRAALVANPPPGSLQGLPGLRLIQSLWAGVDRLLDDPTVPKDVPIARMVDPVMSAAMAETALWATLALHRGFFDNAHAQRGAVWRPQGQRRAGDVTVLVLGLGTMGLAVAQRLAPLGYRLLAWALRARTQAPAGVELHTGAAALPALLARAQIVLNLLPLTPATRGLIDASFLAALPAGAGLVNLGRGAHVVEADLLAALDRGHLGHAVLDVFATEPLPPQHPFWQHPRVTVLPHVAAQTDIESAAAVAVANLRALRDGTPIQHRVARDRGY
jgi:glyoxylate/hydroxypyruvate reductase A